MDEKSKVIVASNLTKAFYSGVERRMAYLGEERRTNPYSPMEDDRIPSLSLNEVFHVYTRFLTMLEEEYQED
jgi:hypothetical protein